MVLQIPDPHAEPQTSNTASKRPADEASPPAAESEMSSEQPTQKPSARLRFWKLAFVRSVTRVKKRLRFLRKGQNINTHGQPFLTTSLGKLPPEIREKVFFNLLESPPPHAGREVSVPYHLQASHLAILSTCRQLYLEAFPVFYARTSYYAAGSKELIHLLGLGCPHRPGPEGFRRDKIETLCVKDLAIYECLSENLDGRIHPFPQYYYDLANRLWNDEKYWELDSNFRSVVQNMKHWTSLTKVCLCMRAGEELTYISFLTEIPGLERGVIEFLDDHKWILYLQPRDSQGWNNHLACIRHRSFHIDQHTNYEVVLEAQLEDEGSMLDTISRASELKDGDERYVEVELVREI